MHPVVQHIPSRPDWDPTKVGIWDGRYQALSHANSRVNGFTVFLCVYRCVECLEGEEINKAVSWKTALRAMLNKLRDERPGLGIAFYDADDLSSRNEQFHDVKADLCIRGRCTVEICRSLRRGGDPSARLRSLAASGRSAPGGRGAVEAPQSGQTLLVSSRDFSGVAVGTKTRVLPTGSHWPWCTRCHRESRRSQTGKHSFELQCDIHAVSHQPARFASVVVYRRLHPGQAATRVLPQFAKPAGSYRKRSAFRAPEWKGPAPPE